MANPMRGEAELVVPGRGTLRLKFDWNSAVEFEQIVERPITDAIADVAAQRTSAKLLRGLIWSGLRAHHAEITPREVGEIIGQVGRPEAVRVMGVALRYYFPEIGPDDPPADPPAPPAST